MLLSVDTANILASIALIKDLDVVGYLENNEKSQQAKMLFPMIEDLLQTHRVGYRDIAAIVVTIGPGSFTGIRIGLSSILGLRAALSLPIYGVTTLDAVAYEAFCYMDTCEELTAILHSVYGKCYVQKFTKKIPYADSEAVILDIDKLSLDTEVICGDLILDNLPSGSCFLKVVPNAKNVGLYATHILESGGSLREVAPYYLRDINITQSKKCI